MNRFIIAAVAASAALSATAASANTVSITGGGSLSCNGSAVTGCVGLTGAGSPAQPTGLGTVSTTTADRYAGNPPQASAVAGRLNTLAGTSFTGTGVGFNGADIGNATTFSTLAQWVVLRIGNDNVFFRNDTNGLVTVALSGITGLNQVRVFGEVPLPAAGWIMAAGLAGLGFAGRRKRA